MAHKRVVVFPYKMGSQSSKDLAKGLGVKRIYPDRAYRGKEGHLIINWGSNSMPDHPGQAQFLNHPERCEAATNKLTALQIMRDTGVSVPDFTTDRAVAAQWIEEGDKVVCRTLLRGHGGGGIVLATEPNELVNAPLYTKYVKKKDEYRIHATRLQGMFDAVQKKVRHGSEGNNFQIRNYENGWVFTREGVNPPQIVRDQALAALQALGLDFGAVDVGYNTYTEQATVYEVNTAPGLEGTTLTTYLEAITNLINS